MNRSLKIKILSLLPIIACLITGCGKDSIFHRESGTFKDSRDKQVYSWVRIGEQVWMAENVSWLPVVNPSGLEAETSSYYYVFGFEGSNVGEARSTGHYITFGVLYNWEAAVNACPKGWHLPTDAEWYALEDHLVTAVGGKLKESGSARWISPNEGGTNESGFSALPGGIRLQGGGFGLVGETALFWSVSAVDASNGLLRSLSAHDDELHRDSRNKTSGLSVRCLRNR